MSFPSSDTIEAYLNRALLSARDTRRVLIDHGLRHDVAIVFAEVFGDHTPILVADERTFAAAGRDVCESFRRVSEASPERILLNNDVWSEYTYVETLQAALESRKDIPVAIGSGTINDLTKLVAHRLGRPYMVVATAASMDGYTAYGASITHRGSKQTFDCPAPRAVVADLDVIARAPEGMNASGYADLLAKGVAGADWILADAAGEEPIDPAVWSIVQSHLPDWVDAPDAVARAEAGALRRLLAGLMASGLAMQAAQSSRPASGAEHQFSHLWDMQHLTHEGVAPSHGFKVGIGTLASLALYEVLLLEDLERLDIEAALKRWPSPGQVEARISALFGTGSLAEKAREEMRAKAVAPQALRAQLERFRDGWPGLRHRLSGHLGPFRDASARLRAAGCPTEPEQVGVSRERLRLSYEQAYLIRRRFTVLDLAARTGLFQRALGDLFGPEGAWAAGAARRR